MDEISSLSREIEFHEKFRGYDPDEVDAYVDKVRNTAALAMGRLSELHERAEAAEARIAAGRGDSTEETLARTLLLAQRTADELVEGARSDAENALAEARAEAAKVIAEAEERSSLILAEAETDRRAAIANAEAEASSAAAQLRDRLAADVSSLSDAKEFLDGDISILERHVEQQRENLAQVVSSLSSLIDDPGSFRVAPAPATSGVGIDAALLEPEVSDDEAVEDSSIVEDSTNVEDVEPESAAPDEEPLEVELADGESSEAEVFEIDFSTIDSDPSESAETNSDESEVINLDEVVSPSDEPELPTWSPEPPRLLTAADISEDVDADDPADQGTSTAPVGVIKATPLFGEQPSSAEALLTADLDDAQNDDVGLLTDDSDALSAFFDQDDDDADRSWFGRRR